MAKYSQEDDRILTVTRRRTNFGQEDSKILYMRVTKTWVENGKVLDMGIAGKKYQERKIRECRRGG
jgi:hypothetical protein